MAAKTGISKEEARDIVLSSIATHEGKHTLQNFHDANTKKKDPKTGKYIENKSEKHKKKHSERRDEQEAFEVQELDYDERTNKQKQK